MSALGLGGIQGLGLAGLDWVFLQFKVQVHGSEV